MPSENPTDAAVIHAGPMHSHPAGLRYGGIRREAQLAYLITRSGLASARIGDYGWELSRVRRLKYGVQIARHREDRRASGRGVLADLSELGGLYAAYHAALDQHPAAKVLVLEHTHEHADLIHAAKDRGLFVVCAPAEINVLRGERLPGPRTANSLRPLRHFLRAYDRADAVFCIGREEVLQLRGFGIAADYLPYYPVPPDLAPLEASRPARSGSARSHFLVLGSAQHPPYRDGMAELLQWIGRLDHLPAPVVVAGIDTEVFAPHAKPGRVEVAGAVSEAELSRLCATAKAVIVHQRFGNGALTKIIEMLIAGVPVLANTIAARSYYGQPGVYVYDTPEELAALMASALPDPPAPGRPVAAEERFVNTIRDAVAK